MPAERLPILAAAMVAEKALEHRRTKATEGRRCVPVIRARAGGSKAPMSVSMSTVDGAAIEPEGARASALMSTAGGDMADGMSTSMCGVMAGAMAIRVVVVAARKYCAATGSAWRADTSPAALRRGRR